MIQRSCFRQISAPYGTTMVYLCWSGFVVFASVGPHGFNAGNVTTLH
jgi:hypothetical protein